MLHRTLVRALGLLVALVLVASACGDSDDGGGTDGAGSDGGASTTAASTTEGDAAGGSDDGATAPEGDPIVLGSIMPHSGPQATAGEFGRQGTDLAVEVINADGGVLGRPLEIVYKDSQAVAEEVVAKLRELDQEGIDLTLGYASSAGCLAAAPIAAQLDMILLTHYCQTTKATGEDFNEHFFRITTNAEIMVRALAKALQQREPDAVDWVSISPDYEFGRNTVTVFKNEMSAEVPEFEMLDETWPPFQSPTYNDYITQVVDDDAQAVFSTLYGADMVNMLKQQAPFGLLDGKVFASAGLDVDVIGPMAASGDLPEMWEGINYYADAFDNPTNAEFVAAFEAEHGTTPTFYPMSGYNSVITYAAAIEEAGSTEVDAVMEALEGLEYDTPMGATTIRAEDHQAVFENIAVIKVVPTDDGSFEVTDTVLVPGEDVTSPPAPGEPNPFASEG